MAKERTAEQQEMMDKMDAAAKEAEAKVKDLKTAADVTAWWKEWYPKAGHKRLGKILVRQSA